MDDPAAPAGGNDLGDFLRARRAALDLRRAGLPDDGRLRRVPGLRREELSRLAPTSASTTSFALSKAGPVESPARCSRRSPTRSISLPTTERTSRRLPKWRAPPAGERQRDPDVADALRQLLEDMHDIPAMVVYRRMHVSAWNVRAAALLTDFGALPPQERNLVRLMFLDEGFRALYADWPQAARDCVAILRMEAGLHPDDPDLIALVGELSIRDEDFRA